MSVGFSVLKKFKIDFQDGDPYGHLGFPIRTITAFFFIYKSHRYLLPSFQSTGLFVQKNFNRLSPDSSSGFYLGFLIRTILAIFYLQVTRILPPKFQANQPFGL